MTRFLIIVAMGIAASFSLVGASVMGSLIARALWDAKYGACTQTIAIYKDQERIESDDPENESHPR